MIVFFIIPLKMFDLKFIGDIKYILEVSEEGVKIRDVAVVNKKQAEKIDDSNNEKLRELDADFAMWVYNRYITKTKKNKYLVGGRGTDLSCMNSEYPVMKF